MSKWFRFYDEALNDPKVQVLPAEDFKTWVNLLCLASQNDGQLPTMDAIAFALRMSVDGARTVVERLSNGGLIDRASGGPDGWHYAPHGWAKRQYKSDTSTERVKRYRKRAKAVTETPPETDTETDTVTNVTGVDPPPKAAEADPVKVLFDEGVTLLTAADVGTAQARSWIGKERQRHGDGLVLKAVRAARDGAVSAPIPWMTKWLANNGAGGDADRRRALLSQADRYHTGAAA